MNLTIEEAFKAMSDFLEKYYKKTASDDVGGLLSDMMLIDDESKTMDPAAWCDWMDSVNTIKQPESDVAFKVESNINLSVEEAFKAMTVFLKRYCDEIDSDDVKILLKTMHETGGEIKMADPAAWDDWIDSVNKIKQSEKK